jgi:hypothetical protein
MNLTSRLCLALSGALLVSACSEDREIRRRELTEISSHHAQDLTALQQAQSAFTQSNPVPRQLDFGKDGTILLHECALDGPLEREQLWMRYTWVNTTSHDIDKAVVTIRVLDPDGAEVEHVDMPLSLPLKFRFSPDSSYTTSVGVPTDGVHLRAGWSWDIRPHATASAIR